MSVTLNGKKIESKITHSGKYARFARSEALEAKKVEGKGEGKVAKGNEGKSKVKDEKDPIKRFKLA